MAYPLPIFPLGMVLFPGAALPLQIFEPRYRRMLGDCLAGSFEFGVVLIERGNEVGGGDVRTDVGTVARILRVEPQPTGRIHVLAVGTRRIQAVTWREDDPYPCAEVEDLADPTDADVPSGDEYAALTAIARRTLALATELGLPCGDPTTAFADDPRLGTFQIAALSPLGPLDRQRVLATEGAGERARLLDRLLTEEADILALRMGRDGDPSGDETI